MPWARWHKAGARSGPLHGMQRVQGTGRVVHTAHPIAARSGPVHGMQRSQAPGLTVDRCGPARDHRKGMKHYDVYPLTSGGLRSTPVV